jgi:hypothetical protein
VLSLVSGTPIAVAIGERHQSCSAVKGCEANVLGLEALGGGPIALLCQVLPHCPTLRYLYQGCCWDKVCAPVWDFSFSGRVCGGRRRLQLFQARLMVCLSHCEERGVRVRSSVRPSKNCDAAPVRDSRERFEGYGVVTCWLVMMLLRVGSKTSPSGVGQSDFESVSLLVGKVCVYA